MLLYGLWLDWLHEFMLPYFVVAVVTDTLGFGLFGYYFGWVGSLLCA